MAADDQLEREIDRLYCLPLEEFIDARDRLAKRLRHDGDRPAAERVKKLRKPLLTAWVVNQLWQRHRDEVVGLLESGGRIRDAHAGDPDSLAAAMDERRRSVAHLLERADEILEAAGREPAETLRRRIRRMLEAVSVLGADGLAEGPGRLTTDVEHSGFDLLGGLAQALRGKPPARPTPSRRRAAGVRAEPATAETAPRQGRRGSVRSPDREKMKAARREVGVAEQLLSAREEAVERALQDLEDADTRRDEAKLAAESARRAAAEAGRAAEDAIDAAERAAQRVAQVREALAEAERELSAAQAVVAELEGAG